MSTISVPCPDSSRACRRPSLVESAAARLGTTLLRWAERRRAVPDGWAEQRRAAIRRRDELSVLRSDALGAAHSGLYGWY
ncbi:2-nitropropane dioxygenase [Pseudarthrobacter sp. S9]|uniref:2-nitropropane dioxygenase n=1 Tax=Pseudarthrobacter sp. S9 TaxID=3418421 RepID=UPI003CFCC2C8